MGFEYHVDHETQKSTECQFKDCLYYGKVDECGYSCDENQVLMCEYIRAPKGPVKEIKWKAVKAAYEL